MKRADLTSISLIEIMGLIGDNCTACQEAAEDPNGGGLAGSWWRAWARVSLVKKNLQLIHRPTISLDI